LLDHRTPLKSLILLVSGRVSFELVQKALMAGIPAWQPSAHPPAWRSQPRNDRA